ncbi:MAG: hypothetical protein A2Y10_15820 [Planctomycetes bacterium GWF2_41_51]|nr:MAG: hypothetical protein A2Y10_15820 [Planctomycetes bacterium GWF2_41_51]HBG27600.1 hypothetical protein [Phycisphaerales bacterium]
MENGLPENDRRRDGDDALVLRAAADSNAFLLLYDIYYEKIFRYVLVRLRLKQISEDVTSRVFIQASANIRRFKGTTRRQFVQWLCNIAEAQIKNYLKTNPLQTIEPQEVTDIDPGHKEKLKSKILSAYNTGKSQKAVYYFTAAAIVIAFIIMIYSLSGKKIDIPKITKKTVPKIETDKPARIIRLIPTQQELTESEEEETEQIELITIGGIVKDQNSQPIQNAAVKIVTAFETKTFKTDANGLWIWHDFDLQDINSIELMATHHGYVTPERFQKANLNQLKTLKFESVLEKGISILGHVVDWQQHSLPATVTKGPFPTSGADIAKCDANGMFKFAKAEEGIVILTAQCEHAAPAIVPIEVNPFMEPVLITLQPPNTIIGHIVDINGMPVEGASISVSSWQGVESLKFSTKTDADGYFQWNSAPADSVMFNIAHKGLMSIRSYAMQTGIDYKIPMMNPFKIKGKIISGSPDVPIVNFIATVGYVFEKENITWQDANSVIFTGDKYELSITEPVEFKIKLQSEGFQTLESPIFSPLSGSMDYDFVMHPEY